MFEREKRGDDKRISISSCLHCIYVQRKGATQQDKARQDNTASITSVNISFDNVLPFRGEIPLVGLKPRILN